ncbi:MAG: hypothetical protein HXX08_03595 [Chloroflexi bacterium]|uniref:YtxH domain-containing protein n=1 Tax=Candidatus Chlorohelix allophototropha TaxID=3003348 RepID=A0A8T7M0L3_9CHLR|nr:hypothetical protein [Chloroflexota bacterium]WJW66822.1 hypothetical protein OZ401_000067 [Chloroflexota bacterium L227-S17]
MGFFAGILKFTIGVTVGATVGAAVTTFIVTRDGGQTLEQLKGLVQEISNGAKEAYQEEQTRQTERRQQLIGDAGTARNTRKAEKKDK